ncbi:MAG: OmpH family outer membrane protein [Bacteroidales bacterium]|nr:OmpH family outer membrane protein [Bacteroidales bacterium]
MIKKILLLVLLVAPMSLAAQMKFASFDYSAIMQAMPETKQAQTELETMGKQFSDELQSMQTEIQTKIDKYNSEINDQTPENIRTRRAQEIQDLQTRYEQAANDNQQAFEEARTKKLQPIMQKVLDAVNSVAKEGNYVYVVDKNASQTAGIIINEALSEDVTVKVLSKLGLSASALTTSSAATGTTN